MTNKILTLALTTTLSAPLLAYTPLEETPIQQTVQTEVIDQAYWHHMADGITWLTA